MKLWLNVSDAAEHAGVCRDTIYTAVERGELWHVHVGRRRWIGLKATWLDAWLEQHTRVSTRSNATDSPGTSGSISGGAGPVGRRHHGASKT